MNENKRPLTEEEKQIKPMPGEVSPKDAATKAREFAVKEKENLRNKK